MDLREMRKASGLSPEQVSTKSGVARNNLASYETGSRSMGEGAAKRIGDAIGETPARVMYASQLRRAQKAIDDEDGPTFLQALRNAVLASEDLELSEADEKRLSELLDDALDIAKGLGDGKAEKPAEDPEEDEDEEDDRDDFGRRTKKSRDSSSFLTPITGNVPTPGARKSDLEDLDRDVFGRRLASLDDPGDDYGDADDTDMGRDLQGRKIRS